MEISKKSEKTTSKKNNRLLILIATSASLFLGNILFLFLLKNEFKTLQLTKNEQTDLERQEKIVSSSQELYQTYQQQTEIISAVFPNEETITVFISQFEETARAFSDSYSLKFNSQVPLAEQDKLFLPLSIIMTTDLPRFIQFLDAMEKMPYMIHITSISTKSPQGFVNLSEINLVFKIYVQKPFSSQ